MCNETYRQFLQDKTFAARHPEIHAKLKQKEDTLKQRLADAMAKDHSHTEALSK
jgi:cell division protein ZapA (FtsZ GTPase activity inhibitor)